MGLTAREIGQSSGESVFRREYRKTKIKCITEANNKRGKDQVE